MKSFKIIDTTPTSVKQYGLCGYKDITTPGYEEKLDWVEKNQTNGLVIKVLHSDEKGTQGMIEYIDGKNCWRPVHADGYLFIHCLFVGFRKEYKNQGFASKMLADCYTDAVEQKKKGMVVLARKGSFMAKPDIFLKNGFELVEKIRPDFQLLVKKVDPSTPSPQYIDNAHLLTTKFQTGLYILRADQCPYTVKNVREMVTAAKKEFNIIPEVIDIRSPKEAQQSPSPFGVFALIMNGKILSHHPVSKTRFCNILRKEL